MSTHKPRLHLKGECHYCERATFIPATPEARAHPGQAGSKDHIVPKSKGGTVTVLACFRCNNAKSDLPYDLFMFWMRSSYLRAFPAQTRDHSVTEMKSLFTDWLHAMAWSGIEIRYGGRSWRGTGIDNTRVA